MSNLQISNIDSHNQQKQTQTNTTVWHQTNSLDRKIKADLEAGFRSEDLEGTLLKV